MRYAYRIPYRPNEVRSRRNLIRILAQLQLLVLLLLAKLKLT